MFYVDVTGDVRRQIRQLFEQACAEGRREAFLTALKAIHQRLEADPREFGEPIYNFRAIRLQIRSAAVRPLFVDYSVSEDHPIVVIRLFKLMG